MSVFDHEVLGRMWREKRTSITIKGGRSFVISTMIPSVAMFPQSLLPVRFASRCGARVFCSGQYDGKRICLACFSQRTRDMVSEVRPFKSETLLATLRTDSVCWERKIFFELSHTQHFFLVTKYCLRRGLDQPH